MRDRLLQFLADQATSRPGRTLALVLLVTLAFGATLPWLRIDAGHSGFIDDDMDAQVRFHDFEARFGDPNKLVLVVEGGSEAIRQGFIDDIAEVLPGKTDDTLPGLCDPDGPAKQDGCVADVLGRLRFESFERIALFMLDTEALREISETLTGDALGYGTLRDLDGLAGVFELLGAQIEAQGEEEAPMGDDLASATTAMDHVAAAFDEFDARLTDPTRAETPLEEALNTKGTLRDGLDKRGYLSSADGAVKLALVMRANGSDNPDLIGPFVRYVKANTRRLTAMANERCTAISCPDGPLTVLITGLPAVIADEATVIAHDMVFTGILTTLGLFFVLIIGFRSFPKSILALAPLGFILIWVLGIAQLLFGGLNLITSVVIPTLLGLGIDFGVHLLARYDEERARGHASKDAVHKAVLGAGPGIFTGAMTTAAAFLVLGLTEFKGFRELGVITGVGLLGAMIITFTVLPALLSLDRFAFLRGPIRSHAPAADGSNMWLSKIPDLVTRHAWGVLAAAVVLSGGLMTFAVEIPWSYDYTELLPEGYESTEAMNHLSERTNYSTEVAAMMADSPEEAHRMARAAMALDTVARVEAITEFMPDDLDAKANLLAGLKTVAVGAIAPAAPVDADRHEAMVDALTDLSDALEDAYFDAKRAESDAAAMLVAPKESVKRLLKTLEGLGANAGAGAGAGAGADADAEKAAFAPLQTLQDDLLALRDRALNAVTGAVATGTLDVNALVAAMPLHMRKRMVSDDLHYAVYIYPAKPIWDREYLSLFVSQLQEISPTATGFPVTHLAFSDSIRESFGQATIMALIALFIVLMIDFRSLRATLLTLTPLGVSVIWTWGILSLLGMRYNSGNVVALPLILGIAVDSGVHIIHRYLRQERGGIAGVIRFTGWAVLLSGLTTMAGFGSLAFADHRAMASLGVFLVVGVGAGLLASTVVLPALLTVIDRRRKTEGDPEA